MKNRRHSRCDLANNTPLETEIRRLLKLNPQELEEALVSAVAKEDEVLAEMRLPTSQPPQSPRQIFASLSLREQIRRVKKAIDEGFEKSKDGLHELVCVKFKYCEKRGADEVRLLATITTGLMGVAGILLVHPLLMPIPAVVVYFHSNGFFNRLCKCPPKK